MPAEFGAGTCPVSTCVPHLHGRGDEGGHDEGALGAGVAAWQLKVPHGPLQTSIHCHQRGNSTESELVLWASSSSPDACL